jgi:hypothetical protein
MENKEEEQFQRELDKAKNQKELETLGRIESEFKALGKAVYSVWKAKQMNLFEPIMQSFDAQFTLTKLKETTK